MRVLIATDAWYPQFNGVVNTYVHLARHAEAAGLDLRFLTHEGFRTVALPTYSEIRLAVIGPSDVAARLAQDEPDCIHIATEGTIGLATRALCVKWGRAFTTSYHTRFPEYLAARAPIPLSWGYRFERWFHNAGAAVMAASPSLVEELTAHGLRNVKLWSRGVDLELFTPSAKAEVLNVKRPIFLYVGRVAVEKNVGAFLDLDLPGTKVVVGGGPQLENLKQRYPEVLFTGPKFGAELAAHYACADVFVFPSLTDTFGNVILEALASGTPVAAFPVTGPKDVIGQNPVGVLLPDLRHAALAALSIDRSACRAYAERFSWLACARRFGEIIAEAHTQPVQIARATCGY